MTHEEANYNGTDVRLPCEHISGCDEEAVVYWRGPSLYETHLVELFDRGRAGLTGRRTRNDYFYGWRAPEGIWLGSREWWDDRAVLAARRWPHPSGAHPHNGEMDTDIRRSRIYHRLPVPPALTSGEPWLLHLSDNDRGKTCLMCGTPLPRPGVHDGRVFMGPAGEVRPEQELHA